jgi:hypothetical protein
VTAAVISTATAIALVAGIGTAFLSAWFAYIFKIRDLRREGEAAQRLLEQGLEGAERALTAALPKELWQVTEREQVPDNAATVLPARWDWTLTVSAWDSYGDRLARHLGGELAAEVGLVVDRLRALRVWMEAARCGEEGPSLRDLWDARRASTEARKRVRNARAYDLGLRRIAIVLAATVAIGVGVFAVLELDAAQLSESEVAGEVASQLTSEEPVISTCDETGVGEWNCTTVIATCPLAQTSPPEGECVTEVDTAVHGNDNEIAFDRAYIEQLNTAAEKPPKRRFLAGVIGRIGRIGEDDGLSTDEP